MFKTNGLIVYRDPGDEIATAVTEGDAIRIVRALNTIEILSHAFPGLIDGETPTNGADLVGMLTKILKSPHSTLTGGL